MHIDIKRMSGCYLYALCFVNLLIPAGYCSMIYMVNNEDSNLPLEEPNLPLEDPNLPPEESNLPLDSSLPHEEPNLPLEDHNLLALISLLRTPIPFKEPNPSSGPQSFLRTSISLLKTPNLPLEVPSLPHEDPKPPS